MAQLGALAVWRNYLNNKAKAIAQYKEALSLGYTKTIGEIYKTAGIEFNYTENYIKETFDIECDQQFTSVEEYVQHIDNQCLNAYFSKIWQPDMKKWKYSGLKLVDEVNALNPRSVLDVGCGYNEFKGKIRNLTGIDPYNDRADYKISIIRSLQDVDQQISALKNNEGLRSGLNELKLVRDNLSRTTQELNNKTRELESVTNNVKNLESTLNKNTYDLAEKNRQLDVLSDTVNGMNTSNQKLKAEVDALNSTIRGTQSELDNNKRQMDSLYATISTMNGALTQQINAIDTIATQLSEGEDAGDQFRQIGQNINDIINMINDGKPNNNNVTVGGRKTMKKRSGKKRNRNRKTKNSMRGGYVYKTNKSLENSSTVISGSSKRSVSNRFRKNV
jgi:predicted  nucleic acid-binding Zn-ribbon protein